MAIATNAFFPADYIMQEQRWGHTALQSSHTIPDAYLLGVEGANLDAAWLRAGKNNRNIFGI